LRYFYPFSRAAFRLAGGTLYKLGGLADHGVTMTPRLTFIPLALAGLPFVLACDSSDEAGADATAGAGGGAARDASAGGAHQGGGAGGSGGTTAPRPTFQAEWLACERAEDCIVVQHRVCNACTTTPINREHEDDMLSVYEGIDCVDRPPGPCPPIPEPTCTAGQCDYIVDCEVMEAARLCGELARCGVLVGRTCQAGDAEPESVRVGCELRPEGVRTEQTCATDPESGQSLVFLSTHIPEGWDTCDLAECDD
jgi:hypothetical protein